MKKFLKKFMSDEMISEVERAYLEKYPEAKELPVYISKERLDEVLAKEHTAEASVADLTKQLDDLKKDQQANIDKAVKEAQENATKHETEALDALKKDFSITEAIWNAKGKNATAIRALIDPSKVVKDEISRLQKSDPYLFESASEDIPGGTGKQGEGDGQGAQAKELQAMREAVGIS